MCYVSRCPKCNAKFDVIYEAKVHHDHKYCSDASLPKAQVNHIPPTFKVPDEERYVFVCIKCVKVDSLKKIASNAKQLQTGLFASNRLYQFYKHIIIKHLLESNTLGKISGYHTSGIGKDLMYLGAYGAKSRTQNYLPDQDIIKYYSLTEYELDNVVEAPFEPE